MVQDQATTTTTTTTTTTNTTTTTTTTTTAAAARIRRVTCIAVSIGAQKPHKTRIYQKVQEESRCKVIRLMLKIASKNWRCLGFIPMPSQAPSNCFSPTSERHSALPLPKRYKSSSLIPCRSLASFYGTTDVTFKLRHTINFARLPVRFVRTAPDGS